MRAHHRQVKKRVRITASASRLSSEIQEWKTQRLREGLNLTEVAHDLCVEVALEALSVAGISKLGPRDGLVMGTTTGQMQVWEPLVEKYFDLERQNLPCIDEDGFQNLLSYQNLKRLAEQVSKKLGLLQDPLLLSSACAASSQALGIGAMLINQGIWDRVIVGGIELDSNLTETGFRALGLSSSEPCKPFSKSRDKIRLSQGVGFLILEGIHQSEQAGQGAVLLSGFGCGSDAYHMTSPHPEGRGAAFAVDMALRSAGLAPSEIDWVHAHGTGSIQNDLSEAIAIQTVMNPKHDANPKFFVSSSKGIHGHSLGASGAVEAVRIYHSLKGTSDSWREGVPKDPDPEIESKIPLRPGHVPPSKVLKTTLGFGGVNTALIFEKGPLPRKVGSDLESQGQAPAAKATPWIISSLEDLSDRNRIAELSKNPKFRKASSNMLYAFDAASQAVSEVKGAKEKIGMILSTERGELATTHQYLRDLSLSNLARPFLFQNSLHHSTTGFLSIELQILGPCFTFVGTQVPDVVPLAILSEGMCDVLLEVHVDGGVKIENGKIIHEGAFAKARVWKKHST